jgi:hypothetical protein
MLLDDVHCCIARYSALQGYLIVAILLELDN